MIGFILDCLFGSCHNIHDIKIKQKSRSQPVFTGSLMFDTTNHILYINTSNSPNGPIWVKVQANLP